MISLNINEEICQTDLGFAGFGSLALSVCGQPLDSGNTALLADGAGHFEAILSGGGGPLSVTMQTVSLDPGQPGGIGRVNTRPARLRPLKDTRRGPRTAG
jgi:hypothetical protein